MKKVLIPIVNRTNYSKLKKVIIELSKLKIKTIVILSSGIAVRNLGNGAEDIYKDKINIECEIDCLLHNDSLESMCKTVGLSLIEHSSSISRINPSATLIVGDRFDMIGPVLASAIMNVPIMHVQGGELSGSIDDIIRKTISINSVRHYVSTDKSHENVFNITGSEYIYNFGCPAVEYVSNVYVGNFLDVSKLKHKFKNCLDIKKNEEYFLVCVHPNTKEDYDIDMDVILSAVLDFGMKTIVIYPNVDAFNKKIVGEVNRYKSRILAFKHVCIDDFVKIMAHSKCMIGNSSAGIREAASFGVPVVNIGNRQKNRERNLNTFDCICNYETIKKTITTACNSVFTKRNIYYKSDSSSNIALNIKEFISKI